ncbi:MAG: hypothetical protein ACTSRZ_08485 [Promethearchaeota archaeon]
MKFNNHRIKVDARFPLGETEEDSFSLIDDFQFADDDEEIKASKDLEFYIRKPFCGCGKCSL